MEVNPTDADRLSIPQVMSAQSATAAESSGASVLTNGIMGSVSGVGASAGPRKSEEANQFNGPVGSYGSVNMTGTLLDGGMRSTVESGARTGRRDTIDTVADFQSVDSLPGAETGAEQRSAERAFLISQSAVVGDGRGFGDNHGRVPGESTPMRTEGRFSSLSAWTTNLESAPPGFRWMSRVGEFLRARAELMPSPFPGASPERESSAAGSQAQIRPLTPPRRSGLQGLLGASIFNNNEPPSSSSGVPSEVIQEEVQRQLGVILGRLEASESHNRLLQAQLEAMQQQAQASQLEAIQHRAQAEQLEAIQHRAQAELLEARQHRNNAAPLEAGQPRAQAESLEASTQQAQAETLEAGPTVTSSEHVSACGATILREPGVAAVTPSQPIPGFANRVGLLQGLFSRPKESNPQRDNPRRSNPGGAGGVGDSQPTRGEGTNSPEQPASSGNPLLDMLSRSVQQLQALQEQALAKDHDSPTAQENVKPGSTTLPILPLAKDELSSLQFQDWIELATISMCDLSDNSAKWWASLLEAVEDAYTRYLSATPIERLSVKPISTELTMGKWTRVNVRACSMLLAAVDETVKQDLISRRISQDMVQSVYRLYIIYQPGGSAEKNHVLGQLQQVAMPGNMSECLVALRAWPRWLKRCRQVGLSLPDPTVLAANLTRITSPFLAAHPDTNFRTQLLRTTLRIEASPTLESVEAYHSHLLAEVEMILSSGIATKGKPSINAMEGQTSTSPTSSPSRGSKGDAPCKYFAKSSGCRRGNKCPYSHDMQQFSREVRAKKCLLCGSESHRKRECPTLELGAKSIGKREEGSAKGRQPIPPSSSSGSPIVAAQVVAAEEEKKGIASEALQGDASQPMTIENLIKVAQQIVKGQPTGSSMSTGDPSSPSLHVMRMLNPIHGSDGTIVKATALVDSGATHPLRKAASSEEWENARAVTVNLAGNRSVEMKLTASGTLLLPVSETGSSTILPVGDLIQTLGYKLDWNRKSCRLIAPDGESMKLSMRDGCPQLPEYQALSLISRLEERKLEQLRNVTLETEDAIRAAVLRMERSWFDSLLEFCKGDLSAGYMAVDKSPFLKDVPEEAKSGLVTESDLSNGWQVLKRMTCWNRAFRRRLLRSNSWIIHFFSGKGSNPAFKPLDAGDNVLLEIDLLNSSQMNVDSQDLWDVIVWGCTHGKVSSILGGPPCRTFSRLRHRPPGPVPVRSREHPFGWSDQSDSGRQEMIKDTRLFCRMIWAHALAVAGRVASSNKQGMVSSEVAFLLEQPADPQDYMDPNDPVYHEVPSFWATSLWELYSQEAGLMKVTFNQGAMGHVTSKPTSLGTNMVELCVLEGMREEHKLPAYNGPSNELAIWSPGMCWAISLVLRRWLCRPRVLALTRAQWQQHIKNHHTPYEKTCEVCVTSSGTGRRHVRVEHPESFVLSADVSGPLREGGLDTNGRGAHPKPHKYLLVATLRLPESYLQGYSSGKCDLTHSWSEAWVSTEPEPDDGLGLEFESVPLSAGHVEDTEPEAISLKVHPSEGPLGDEVSGELHDMDRVTAEGALPLQHPLEALGFRDDGEGLIPAVEEEHRSVRGESVVDEADLLGADVHGVDGEEEQTSREERTDLSPPKLARMLFSIPIPDAKSATIKEALQDVLLYLRTHNVPVLRFHSDRASVFMARDTRQMLKGWGLRVTTSEGAVPQTNGVAEAGVKWVKQRIRALLIGSGLPLRLWPSAADTACILQRAALTGMASKLAAPFGSTVHVRKRPYTGVGTTAKPDSLRSQWIKGKYLGLSSTLSSGHVIYIPPEDGQPESFIHTFHVRCLTDPGFLEEEFHEHIPDPPLRRIRGKQPPPPEISSAQVTSSGSESINDLQCEAEEVLAHWNQDRALMLLDRASRLLDATDFKVGAFRHGGVTGLLKDTEKYPWLSRLMVRCFTELDNEITFTAVYMSINTERNAHVDKNNQGGSMNYVIPVVSPKSGGGLWVELKNGDQVLGPVTTRTDSSGRQRFGTTRPLERGKVMQFDARRLHATEPWRGRRVVLIAYTPALVHKLDQQDITKMVRLGFPVESDLSDGEGFDVKDLSNERSNLERAGGWSEVLPAGGTNYHFDVSWRIRGEPGPSMAMLHAKAVECMDELGKHATIHSFRGSDRCPGFVENLESRTDTVVEPGVNVSMYSGEVYLDLNHGGDAPDMARLCMGEEEHVPLDGHSLYKAEVGYTREVERVIRNLTGPLEVVHNVDPVEVLENIQVWIPAIEKELKAVAHAVDKIPRGDERHSALLRSAKVQRLPTKLVFTVKPGDNPQPEQPESWFKRKVRLVACGNLAAASSMDTYSGTAPAEVVRIALVLANKFGWIAGIVDIVSAFLRTPLIGDDAPQIVVHPPKVLERASLIPVGELWKLTHALYGLREAPHLWSMYRDEKLRLLIFTCDGKSLRLVQGRAEGSWWTIREEDDSVVGVVVIYVDDILMCSSIHVVRALASALSGLWKTTDLALVVKGCPLRFLGLEIDVDETGVFWISQGGFIKELLRSREISKQRRDLVPITKELSTLESVEPDDESCEDLVRDAQGATGEILWLSQRSRPDLAFPASIMASMSTKCPSRTMQIARKAFGYVQRTMEYRLKLEAATSTLSLCTDSSFAPDSSRSHTGWVVLLYGSPVLWKSSRQTTVSLSTAEAELNATLEGSLALLSIEALLKDLGLSFDEKEVLTDSTSALTIASGSGSWRTRHLRVKAQWLQEQIAMNKFKLGHCRGEKLVADLLTKALSSGRVQFLLSLWGMDTSVSDEAQAEPIAEAADTSIQQHSAVRASPPNSRVAKALLALLALLQLRESEGMELVPQSEAPRGIPVDQTLLSVYWMAMVFAAFILGWEGLKWLVIITSRRARRLARLRWRTAEVVRRELQRLEEVPAVTESDVQTERPAPKLRQRRVSTAQTGRRRQATGDQATSSSSRPRRRATESQESEVVQVASSSAGVDLRTEGPPSDLEETVVRGLYTRRERGPPIHQFVQTDPWEPQRIEIPVRVEVPVEIPARAQPLFQDRDLQPLQAGFTMSQYGEHVHLSSTCEGLRNASRLRNVQLCLHCAQTAEIYVRQRAFRRLTPHRTR